MPLYDAMKMRGYTFRQHLEEECWGWQEPTVVDLDTVQRDALKHGGVKGLKEHLDQRLYRPARMGTVDLSDVRHPGAAPPASGSGAFPERTRHGVGHRA